jgi:hypothetical protein
MPQLRTTKYLILFISLQAPPRGRDTFFNGCCKKNRQPPRKNLSDMHSTGRKPAQATGKTVRPAERQARRNRNHKNIPPTMLSQASTIKKAKEGSFASSDKLYCLESSRPAMSYGTSHVKKYDTFLALICAARKNGTGTAQPGKRGYTSSDSFTADAMLSRGSKVTR